MKIFSHPYIAGMAALLMSVFAPAEGVPAEEPGGEARSAHPIPRARLAAEASSLMGPGFLGVESFERGARARCVRQRLECEITEHGLALHSTAENLPGILTLRAAGLGRTGDGVGRKQLAERGEVLMLDGQAQWVRPGLIEEFSVSADGLRQDFIVTERPSGEGDLLVQLEVDGAEVKTLGDDLVLLLRGSKRRLEYGRLLVLDARSQAIPARFNRSGERVAIVVSDADAVYPLRIDPTFSDETWASSGGFPGTTLLTYASVADDAGNIYIAEGLPNTGLPKVAGDTWALKIAKWDGVKWSPLGAGINGSGFIKSLAARGTDLYVGGGFTTAGGQPANNIAKWDGAAWSPLGSGVNGVVYAIKVIGADLYVGGNFTMAGGQPAKNIAKWDGNVWSPLGSGANAPVLSLEAIKTDLYAGGQFTAAGGVSANRIAKWNGNTWSPLRNGANAYIYTMAVMGTDLYVGGPFTQVDGVTRRSVAKWNGSQWSSLGAGFQNRIVYCSAVMGTDVYVGLGNPTGDEIPCVYKWNGSAWSPVWDGKNAFRDHVETLAASGGILYAGGCFSTETSGVKGPNTVLASRFAQWDGQKWSAVVHKKGLDGHVNALVVSGKDLYLGGRFSTVDGIGARGVAKWDGESWSSPAGGVPFPGSLMTSDVTALAVSGEVVYAAGTFEPIYSPGTTLYSVFKWNGNSWTKLGTGMNGAVEALAVFDNELYAGGEFTTAGGVGASYLAKWGSAGWTPVDSVIDGPVTRLEVIGENLYAGSEFSPVPDGPVKGCIAKWDGSAWSVLGTGTPLPGRVKGMAIRGMEFYATCRPPTVSKDQVYKLEGGSWISLGSPTEDAKRVECLLATETGVYAGVDPGTGTCKFARWDGNDWTTLATGFYGDPGYTSTADKGRMRALANVGSDLYVAGMFIVAAGDIVSPSLAKLVLSQPDIAIEDPDGTDLVNHSGAVDCGMVNLGGSGAQIRFTVRNQGTRDLTDMTVSFAGGESGDFSASNLDANELAPGDYATFTVTFTPGAPGARQTTIQITSNDPDENPFTVALSGEGIAPPIASFIASPNLTVCGQAVSFNSASTVHPGRAITSTAWDFGDGAVATGIAPSHAYSASGSYTVTLTVTDDSTPPQIDTETLIITVEDPAIPVVVWPPDQSVVAGMSIEPSAMGVPIATDECGTPAVSYEDATTPNPGCPGGLILRRTWTVSDGYNSVQHIQTITVGTGSGPAAQVLQHPQDQTVALGMPAAFTVSVLADCGATFQWLRNGVVIPGATSAVYTRAVAAATDNGAQFACRVRTGTTIQTRSAMLFVTGTIPVPTPPDQPGLNIELDHADPQVAVFRFPTEPGFLYRLQGRESNGVEWLNLSLEIPGNGDPVEIRLPVAELPSGTFRTMVVPLVIP